MTIKALFLIFHGFSPHQGISKKIGYQIKALQQCGMDVQLCYLTIDENGHHKRMINKETLEDYGKGMLAKIKKRINYSKLADYIFETKIRFLYIRSFHNANPFLISMLRKLKKKGITAVLEIPTFPYDQEYKKVKLVELPGIFFDRLLRKKLAKQVKRIVTFSNDRFIFDSPTINISNGIDFDEIKTRKQSHPRPDFIRLIGVAEIHFWHGFDRVITGLSNYYKTNTPLKVYFDIVGDGVPGELAKLNALVAENKLEEFVTFHGPKSGDALDQLFEETDMGIGSLGRHRSQITYIKPLKNREYAARGIPFIYSEIDEDFEHMAYVMKAPADESPLDINRIIEFIYQNNFKPEDIRKTIVEKLSWKIQMGKVAKITESTVY
ncbi:MAG: glycosyltransferase [Prolixibacteraceae bacterium]